jgi:hypothetical protein
MTPAAVTVTRPRHPLEGRQLPVLGSMRRHGRLELLLILPDGSKSLIPAAWTDLEGGIEVTGAGEMAATLGSLEDLLAASALVSSFSARDRPEPEQAARQSPCKEDSHAACAAQSAAGPGSGATPDPAGPAPRTARRDRDHADGLPDRQSVRPEGRPGHDADDDGGERR